MSDARRQSQIIMALEEIKCGRAKSVRAAAIAFEVPYTTLRDRMNGVTWKDLNVKGYPAKYEDIIQMAQSILGLKTRMHRRTYGNLEQNGPNVL
ncbi:hypothetical protein HI914_02010 [Erysiphe necator]|nr:hypothetical protein HI914_02010 [Erysiphe necator]